MKNKLTYLMVLITLLLSGCSEKDKDRKFPVSGAVLSKYFVQEYVEADEIKLRYDYYLDLIAGWLDGEYYECYRTSTKEKHEQLAIRYNDLSYNGYLIKGDNYASCDDFTSLSMTCEQDIDADHPAGSSLGDVVKFSATHAYPFVSSGYTANMGYTPIYKFLDDVTPYDLLLLDPQFYFELPKDLPAGKYTFHVAIANADKTLTASVDYTKP